MSIKLKSLGAWILPLLSVSSFAIPSSDIRLAEGVEHQDKDAVRSLLKQHVDVNAPEADGSTALVWAAHWDDLETADLLIRAGANANAVNDYGVTPLWEACNNASAAMVEKLSKAGANPNATLLRSGESALMRCARTGNVEAVNSLLAHGADVNAKENERGQTALMWALEERHTEAAQALIRHGADIHAKSKGGFTPLLYAARQGDLESGSMLLEKGADVNEPAPGGQNALLVATDCGQEAFAIFLVEKGANPNATDPNGLTAMHYALRKGISILRAVLHEPGYAGLGDYLLRPDMSELVKALLEHGANPNARIKLDLARYIVNDRPQLGLSGATPFLLAAASGNVGLMRILLAKGADPNLATNDNTTPLMVAAGVGRRENRTKDEERQGLEAVKLLVELGADVNAASRYMGLTAMHGAAFTGENEIIQFLASKGAKLDPMDRFGQTPLSMAAGDPNGMRSNYSEVVQDHQSTVNLLRKLGGDPLTPPTDIASVNANQ